MIGSERKGRSHVVNVAAPLWENATLHPKHIAIRAHGTELTYAEVRASAAAFGGDVAAAGIGRGDRVLLIAPSIPEFVSAYYGLHLVGATAITMNTMSTTREIEYVLEDSRACLVIAWHESSDAAVRAAVDLQLPFWTLEPGAKVSGKASPVLAPAEIDGEDTSVILYTSGTTGRPKGAELTAANLLGCSEAFLEVLELTMNDRFGTALPLFHVYGQAVVMNTVLRAGATLSLLHPFEPNAILDMARDDRLTGLAGVPTMWNAMLRASGDFTASDFENLRLATSGGASLPAEVIRAFTERFDCAILEGYGLTETTGAATFNGLNRERKVGTVGIALPGSVVEIRDANGMPLPSGEVGEIFIKGPTVMKGYWGHPDATAADLQDGWLKSGDLGSMDVDGDIRIVDRVKDLIIRGGYNVYPREVEEVLYEHPDIVEVAVVGVPDEHYGEEVAAVIALAPASELTAETLRAWAKEQLSAYKVPRLFQFVEELPKGATGKILKRAIDRDAFVSNNQGVKNK